MNRRQFLLAPASLVSLPSMAAEGDWFDKPMRWVQIAFVEDDPGQYNPRFWLDYMKRVHADGACLSAGGYTAFYPTKIPFHHTSSFMKPGMDPFGELLEGCRKLGMHVIARTDPHACRDDVFKAHPDWIAVDEKGQKIRHWADKRLWVTCTLGPYNWEFMSSVAREVMERYKPDGIFTNRWEGSDLCWCENCKRNFKAATGLELPASHDKRDKNRRVYDEWRQNRFFDLWKKTDLEIKAISPRACFIPNVGGADRLLDMARIGEMAPILFIDRQARRNNPAWFSGKSGKEYRSTLGRTPVGSITSVGHEESYRWKDSVQNPAEFKMFFADAIANGCRPWVTKFNAKIIDERWLKPVEEVYTWCWRNERWLRNVEAIANVALVYTQPPSDAEHLNGFYHALVESRIPFEMVHAGQLTPDVVDRFRVLILPSLASLSEKQCAQFASYVKRGGSLVATYETSLYDERGTMRNDLGLGQLFGCSYAGGVVRRMQNSYLSLEHATKHPLLRGLSDTPRIINGTRRVATRPLDRAYRAPVTLIPTYPDLPMEEVYPRADSKTTQPEVYLREYGRGRVVYFPFDLDRTFFEVMATDHLTLLRNAVEWAMGEDTPPVRVTGPGLLDVTAFRQAASMTVHIVNLTNPMAMRGPMRETIPVGPLHVSAAVPAARKVTSARLLTADRVVPFAVRGGRVEIDVPTVALHEVVALELS